MNPSQVVQRQNENVMDTWNKNQKITFFQESMFKIFKDISSSGDQINVLEQKFLQDLQEQQEKVAVAKKKKEKEKKEEKK